MTPRHATFRPETPSPAASLAFYKARDKKAGLRPFQIAKALANLVACKCGTGILPVFHGRDAHATRGLAKASAYCRLPLPTACCLLLALPLLSATLRAAELPSARITLDPPRPFAGQPFTLQLEIATAPGSEIQNPELRGLPGGTHLEFGKFSSLPAQRVVRDGRTVELHRYRSRVRPVASFNTIVEPMLAYQQVERRSSGFFTSWQTVRRRLDIPPTRIEIRPLPTAGRPADFAGAIGEFTLRGGVEPDVVVPLDLVTLTVEISGKGTLGEARPQLPKLDPALFKVYPPKETRSGEERITLVQTIIPQSTQAVEVAGASFSFFDTTREQYRTITTGPFRLAFTTREAATAPAVRKVEVTALRPDGTRQELPVEVSMYRELRRVIPLTAGVLAALGFIAIFRPTHKRMAVIAGLLLLVGVTWATHLWIGKERITRIPLKQTAALRIAPGERAHSSIELPEGTPVRLLGQGHGWLRIEAGGHRGWIPATSLSADD